MVALRTAAQTLAHLRSAGVGVFAMRRRARALHLAGLSLALLGACGPPSLPADRQRAGPLTVTDDAGRTVALAGPARRIVSLAPSSTELLFALGAGDRVVGRTSWCRYPPEAARVPAVGDGLNPNIEAVAARTPDLVVLYRSALNATAAEQLARLGIPAVILAQDRLEDVARDARALGRLVDREAAGDSLAAELERLAAAPAPPPIARLAFVVWDNPPTVIGAGSFLDQLARLAGGVNVFADIVTPSAVVSLETLVARDPDVIVVIREDSTGAAPSFAARREWQAVRAVRQRRLVSAPAELFGQPSPRAAEAVTTLTRLLVEATR
jgi:iron complex transport system substrate-binding protein